MDKIKWATAGTGIFGMILALVGVPLESLFCMVAGSVMAILGLLFFVIAANVDYNDGLKSFLNTLAREQGYSGFVCGIGSCRGPFVIDTEQKLFAGLFPNGRIKIAPISHITGWALDPITETVDHTASRAFVGGMLAGTAGAIAGAASAQPEDRETGMSVLKIETDIEDYELMICEVSTITGRRIVNYLSRNV